MSDLAELGRKVAGSEQQAKQLVQRALAVLGFRVVNKSWGMCIETTDGKCDVVFDGWPDFSSSWSLSWSSILGKLVACRKFGVETKEDRLLDGEKDSGHAATSKWTSNSLFGCESMEEVEMKLDLLGSKYMEDKTAERR